MNILIAEHESLHNLLEGLITMWGYQTHTAHDVNEVWSAFYGAEAPTCLVIDWRMPNVDGSELCRRLRERQGDYVYILLITDEERTQDVVEGLSAGADDYITQPFDGRELRVRLRVAQRILDLQRELAASREMLRTHALRDTETGLWNRVALTEILEREINRARREAIALSIITVRCGECAQTTESDASLGLALRGLAHRIRHTVRSYDDVGRLAENQILVILPGCDRERANMVGQRIRQAAAEGEAHGALPPMVALSMGIATLTPGEGLNAERMLERAAAALV